MQPSPTRLRSSSYAVACPPPVAADVAPRTSMPAGRARLPRALISLGKDERHDGRRVRLWLRGRLEVARQIRARRSLALPFRLMVSRLPPRQEISSRPRLRVAVKGSGM